MSRHLANPTAPATDMMTFRAIVLATLASIAIVLVALTYAFHFLSPHIDHPATWHPAPRATIAPRATATPPAPSAQPTDPTASDDPRFDIFSGGIGSANSDTDI